MSTFRNDQINEILNNERRMNRVIFDRVSDHVATIGDERAPPTMRDIKMEATLGSLIDVLKEKINKAIQLVSAFQYGKLDSNRADRLLKTNDKNQRKIKDSHIDKTTDESSTPPDLKEDEDDSSYIETYNNAPPEESSGVVAFQGNQHK